jgi:translation initiation factor IF-3
LTGLHFIPTVTADSKQTLTPTAIRHRSRNRGRPIPEPERAFRINEKIAVPLVRVIDDQGVNLGDLTVPAAVAIAQERGLDLVEVNPKADPPTCRLIDYGKFRYQENKKSAKTKAKRVEVKGIRLTAKIGSGDLQMRQRQAMAFLAEGHKVKIELIMRGRENAHADLSTRNIQDFVASLGDKIVIEQLVSRTGNRLSTVIASRH